MISTKRKLTAIRTQDQIRLLVVYVVEMIYRMIKIRLKCLHLHYAHYLVTKRSNTTTTNYTEGTCCINKEIDFTNVIDSNVKIYNLAGYKVHKLL